MKHLSDTEKYLEVRGTLEFIVRNLRAVYNQGMFNSAQKRYIFNLLREGDITLKKVTE
jgi:hypothetical protein